MSIALSIIVKSWKQPKCPSTDEYIKKMWYIHTISLICEISETKQMNMAGKKKESSQETDF